MEYLPNIMFSIHIFQPRWFRNKISGDSFNLSSFDEIVISILIWYYSTDHELSKYHKIGLFACIKTVHFRLLLIALFRQAWKWNIETLLFNKITAWVFSFATFFFVRRVDSQNCLYFALDYVIIWLSNRQTKKTP